MQRQSPALDLRPWFVALKDLPGPIDFASYFGTDRPLEIEVGSGRGQFLVNAATANPAHNFLGIEIDFREGRRAADRLRRRELHNARVVGGDVQFAFDKFIPTGCADVVHVYFPDPWWKKKHRKRRVFTEEFVGQMLAILKPGGVVSSATDVPDYFEVIAGLMDHHSDFETISHRVAESLVDEPATPTNFERKARSEGSQIHRGVWRKR